MDLIESENTMVFIQLYQEEALLFSTNMLVPVLKKKHRKKSIQNSNRQNQSLIYYPFSMQFRTDQEPSQL
jgi:hypothetical protein